MKKLCILSEESIISGSAFTGVGEMADSIGNIMSTIYDVSVVTVDGGGMLANMSPKIEGLRPGVKRCRMFGSTYYLIHKSKWLTEAPAVVAEIAPDILHSFVEPGMIAGIAGSLNKKVYTIDNVDLIDDPQDLLLYDTVTTVSESYAAELLAREDELGEVLNEIDFRGITNGVLSNVFSPANGLLLTAKYTPEDQRGKARCKNRLYSMYGVATDAPVYLMMCRLVENKGVRHVLNNMDAIRAAGGHLIVVGHGAEEFETRMRDMELASDVTWVCSYQLLVRALPLLAGADFFLSPSIHEPCGLMPMNACRYGAIPITTLAGGLADNMDDSIAIVIDSASDIADGIARSAVLYADKMALMEKRRAAMTKDFSWATRKQGYIEVYEA